METLELEVEEVGGKIEFIRQNLKLTQEEWDMLAALAAATHSLAPTGTNAGLPSWRTLIKRIADGEFIIKPAPKKVTR